LGFIIAKNYAATKMTIMNNWVGLNMRLIACKVLVIQLSIQTSNLKKNTFPNIKLENCLPRSMFDGHKLTLTQVQSTV